jgi:dihydrofolate reductase
MRKIVLLMHVSLDGFVAGLNGEMDWIKLDNELWDYVTSVTDAADTAVYGAITFRMMESYWPTAATQPGATAHDIDHARWVNNAHKLVVSKSIKSSNWADTEILHENIEKRMLELKHTSGKNLLMLGSPSLAQSFMEAGLIDELRLNVNPVVLGAGKPLFKDGAGRIDLKLEGRRPFASGVVGLHYDLLRNP